MNDVDARIVAELVAEGYGETIKPMAGTGEWKSYDGRIMAQGGESGEILELAIKIVGYKLLISAWGGGTDEIGLRFKQMLAKAQAEERVEPCTSTE